MRSDIGSVFSAIRRMRPSASMNIMSKGMSVFFIHIATSWSRPKSNNMPVPSGSSLRNIRPRARSLSVTASSTENTWTPPLPTISRLCGSAERAGMPASTKPASTTAAITDARRCAGELRDGDTRTHSRGRPTFVKEKSILSAMPARADRRCPAGFPPP